MATPAHTTQTWRFGVFEVDAQREELRRAGIPIKLREQSFRVLVLLLEHSGELVTREELRKALWPSDTFVDFDHGLNTAVMKLREALGDTADKPIYIETIPKRGYRFIAPVTSNRDQPSEVSQPTPPISAEDHKTGAGNGGSSIAPVQRHALRNPAIFVTVLLGAIGSILILRYVLLQSRKTSQAVTNYRITPLTSANGAFDHPAISRDGRAVAYLWNGTERRLHSDVYWQLIGSSDEALRLTYLKSGIIGYPTWSPDGSVIAFTWCNGGDDGVYFVPALGGTQRKLTSVGCQYNVPEPLAWFADGARMLMIDRCSVGGPFGLVVFSLETGEKKCLADFGPKGYQRTYQYSLSPDEETVAFNPAWETPDCAIYTVPVSGGTPHRVVKDDRPCNHLMWASDGKSIVFTSQRTASWSRWRVPAGGGKFQPETVYPALGRFSRDGRRFVFGELANGEPASIWRADFAGAGGKALKNTQVIHTQFGELDAQPSLDGSQVAWMSYRSGFAEIWVSKATGESPRQLTHMGIYAGSPRWSPDGKWIAFDSDTADGTQLFVIGAEGRNQRPISHGPYHNVVPSWSRDGKSIYFASNRTGRDEVWKLSLDTGKELQLTTHGGFDPFESFDGKTVYFSKFDQAGIWSIPSGGGSDSLVVRGKPQIMYWGHWAVTRTGLYVLNTDEGSKGCIEFYDFAMHQTRPVLYLDKRPQWGQPSLSATADGETVYYAQGDSQSVIKLMELQQ